MKHLVHNMPNYYSWQRDGAELHKIVERFEKAAHKVKECDSCGKWFSPDLLKFAQKFDYSTGEWNDREICFRCAGKLVIQSDWKVG